MSALLRIAAIIVAFVAIAVALSGVNPGPSANDPTASVGLAIAALALLQASRADR